MILCFHIIEPTSLCQSFIHLWWVSSTQILAYLVRIRKKGREKEEKKKKEIRRRCRLSRLFLSFFSFVPVHAPLPQLHPHSHLACRLITNSSFLLSSHCRLVRSFLFICFFFTSLMSNYRSQTTLSSLYSFPTIRQYPPQRYYYSSNEYSSSPFLSYTDSSTSYDPYSSLLNYYDEDEEAAAYLSEYHQQYSPSSSSSSYRKGSRARNISR